MDEINNKTKEELIDEINRLKSIINALEYEVPKDIERKIAFTNKLMSVIQNGLIICGSDGEILRVNEAFLNLSGYNKKDLVGKKPPYPFWPRENYADIVRNIKDTLHDKKESFEMNLKQANNNKITVTVNTVWMNEKSEKENYIITFRDISEIKKAENIFKNKIEFHKNTLLELTDIEFTELFNIDEIQNIQNALSNSYNIPLVIIDPKGRFITKPSNQYSINKNEITDFFDFHKIIIENIHDSPDIINDGKINIKKCKECELQYGISKINIGNKLIASWIIGLVRYESQEINGILNEISKNNKEMLEMCKSLINFIPTIKEENFININEALNLISNQLSSLAIQNIRKAYAIVERENAEKEIIKLNDILERQNIELSKSNIKLEEINKQLRVEKFKAEKANIAKSEFLAVMSHELRTPLNGILGHAQILSMNPTQNIRMQKAVDVILKSGEHLLTIIQDILDIASIESGKDKYVEESFSISDMVNSVLDMMKTEIEKTKINIKVDIPNLFIKTDKAKLRQILINLISNARKFTFTGGSIHITMKVNNDKLLFSVIDTGIGIPAENLENIFNPFYQVDYSIKRNFGGTGLGLSLCKRLANKLGGDIWVESTLNKGSKFYFTIDYNKVDKKILDNSHNIKIYDNLKNINILVVDDDKMSLSVLFSLFDKIDISYLIAQDGKEALEVLEKKHKEINIILMDLQMPNIDGFKATTIIKNHDNYKRIPVIAVTAFARDEDKERCDIIGFDDYISKPFSIDTILKKIENLTIYKNKS